MNGKCQAVSPESGTPCALSDTSAAHYKGHETDWRDDDLKIAWATTESDHKRWDPAK